MPESYYRQKYRLLAETVVPKARGIAGEWVKLHPDLRVEIWAPHPDNTAPTQKDPNGRIIRHSERFVHVMGFHPGSEIPGRRREKFPELLEFSFPGEEPSHLHKIESAVLLPLNVTEQWALGELAASLFTDPEIAAAIWQPQTARGVTQKVRLPYDVKLEDTLAILYKLFPNR